MKGQVTVNRLKGYAIAFVVIGVALAVGLNVMGNVQSQSYATDSVDNETADVAASSPAIYTVSHASDGDFYEVTSATCYGAVNQTNEVNCDISDASAGELNVTEGDLNDTGDESFDYDFDYEGEAFEGAGQAMEGLTTFTDWLPLIALVVIAALIIGLLGLFRSRGRTKGK